jgi:hypothetical protein
MGNPWIPFGVAILLLVGSPAAIVGGQGAHAPAGLHRPLDEILDVNVRDGYVYYLALKQARGKLDRYLASLDVPAADFVRWPRDERLAFWINAYDAFVLQTVIDHYPIRGRAPEYPAASIRQIPGAFDRLPHRAAGRSVTLDQIEQTILPEFHDPRVYLVLGRGAVGSGRLRSEAYDAARLESQITEMTTEFVTTRSHVEIDRVAGVVRMSPIIGWHEAEFVGAYAEGDPRYAARSPIERAVIALALPHLYPTEQAFIEANQFRVVYRDFDWRLNDLTGGRK